MSCDTVYLDTQQPINEQATFDVSNLKLLLLRPVEDPTTGLFSCVIIRGFFDFQGPLMQQCQLFQSFEYWRPRSKWLIFNTYLTPNTSIGFNIIYALKRVIWTMHLTDSLVVVDNNSYIIFNVQEVLVMFWRHWQCLYTQDVQVMQQRLPTDSR